MDDLEAVYKLMNICEMARYGRAETTLEDLRSNWTAPQVDLEKDGRIILAPDQQVVGNVAVFTREHVQIYIFGEVHPDYYNLGLGEYLLRWAEERAREQIALAPLDARVTLQTGVDKGNSAKKSLLEKLSYTPVRSFWRMGIELQETPPVAQWPATISLRTFTPDMEQALYEADKEAFSDHWGFMPESFDVWPYWNRQRPRTDYSLIFLAMDRDQIAGFALCVNEQEAGGWVHVLAVRRPWRRQGIAQALLYHAFGEFYRRGVQQVYLGVDAQSLTGATRLYERVGMHVVRQSTRYQKELRAGKELSTQEIDAL
jgi:GNAT superfamily N-acetyltransferase